jgi:hypothetical protein
VGTSQHTGEVTDHAAYEDNTLCGAGGALCGHDVNGINDDVAFKLLFIKFFMYVCQ